MSRQAHKPLKLLGSKPVNKSRVQGFVAMLMQQYPHLSADSAKVLIPPKALLLLNKYIPRGGGDTLLVYVVNGLPIFFEIERDVLLPTVSLLSLSRIHITLTSDGQLGLFTRRAMMKSIPSFFSLLSSPLPRIAGIAKDSFRFSRCGNCQTCSQRSQLGSKSYRG